MLSAEDLKPAPPCAAHLITTLLDLEQLAARLLASPIIAIDTESDSLFSYNEKICLVQVSMPGEDFIIDPLAIYSLEPLADVFASPAVEKVFHGADYDLVSLKRGYGFHVVNIFDTMVTARILGHKSVGLAALVAEHIGLHIDKTMQRSDWGQRPLTPEQLAYACHDTRYLLAIHDILLAELQQKGRVAEAREAFAELETLEPKTRIFDPDTFWNIKGVHELDDAGRRIVRAIYRWREDQARWEDRPVFKVLSDRTLVALGQKKPDSLEGLRRSRLLSPYQITRYGHQVVDLAVKADNSKERLSAPRHRHAVGRPDDITLAIYEQLRAWRKERAAARGVEPDVIIANDVLMALATRRPRTPAELETIGGLGAWRRNQYGPEMLAVINKIIAP